MNTSSKLSFGKKILFSLIAVVMFFAAAEGFLRLFHLPFSSPVLNERTEMWKRKGVQQDPTLPWSWAPIPNGICRWSDRGFFRFNSLGFRGPIFQVQKAPNTFRIVCMGDSCTMGWQVRDDRTYCALLPSLLQAKLSKHVESINAGVLGYATSQGLHQLRARILELHPDLIIASYNWNDHGPAILLEGSRPDRDLPKQAPSMFRLQIALSKLRIVQCLQLVVSKFSRSSESDINEIRMEGERRPIPRILRVPVQDYVRNWEEFIKIAKYNQITVILMTQPYKPANAPDPTIEFFQEKQEEYNQALKEVARRKGIPCLDVTPDFNAHGNLREIFSSIVHPTALGHRLIAEKVAALIISERLENPAKQSPFQ